MKSLHFEQAQWQVRFMFFLHWSVYTLCMSKSCPNDYNARSNIAYFSIIKNRKRIGRKKEISDIKCTHTSLVALSMVRMLLDVYCWCHYFPVRAPAAFWVREMHFLEFRLLHYVPKISQSIWLDLKTVARRLVMRFRYMRGHCAMELNFGLKIC